jgi:hypothetical protein
MFYLARLTSSSSHSLAATIGYASGGALGWRARLEPRGGLTAIRVPFPAASPAAAPPIRILSSNAGSRRGIAYSDR